MDILSCRAPHPVPYLSLTHPLPVPYFYTIELDLIEICLVLMEFSNLYFVLSVKQAEKLKSREMKNEGRRIKDEGWRMNVEWWLC